MMRRCAIALAVLLPLTAALTTALPAEARARHHHAHAPHWQEHVVPSKESLRGLDAVDRRTAWAAGDDGGVWRTTDGGRTWQDVAPKGTDDLAFRDVEALGRNTAVVLSIGEGDQSRIYRTADGGRTWRNSFVNDDPAAFYDCMAFFRGGRQGLALSDPVDGKFRVLATRDGGRTWSVRPDDGMPAAVPGEFAFAASGTCIDTAGRRDAWIGSGGTASRIYHSHDRGRTWTVVDAPIPASPAGGVFSVAFDRPQRGVAVGGDFEDEANGVDASAYSETATPGEAAGTSVATGPASAGCGTRGAPRSRSGPTGPISPATPVGPGRR